MAGSWYPISSLISVFFLCILLPIKTLTATSVMTPIAAPTPIPALAPVDRVPLSLFGAGAVGEGLEALDEPVTRGPLVEDERELVVTELTNSRST